jgi:ribosomal protein L40E
MTKQTIGYVELEWTCKRCGTRNPGMQKTCSGCGSVMSEQDKFEAPAQQELITDKDKLEQAKRGPDIHCPYCGARNPAGSEKCGQCSAGLKDAKARETGQTLGAYQAGPVADVPCLYCGEKNPANAAKCKKCGGNLQKTAAPPPAQPASGAGFPIGLGIGMAVLVGLCIICVIGYFVLGSRTTDTVAVVESVQWERAIQIEEMRPVEHEEWQDQIPSGAKRGACAQKLRKTQSEPAPGAEQVCGTPYTVDQGSGIGKVVQECEYNIYDKWCKYTINEWTVVDKKTKQGNDFNPQWPGLNLQAGQREGKRSENYKVIFKADDKQDAYTYRPNSASEFSQFTVGSQWTLKVNTFGAVTDAQSAQ